MVLKVAASSPISVRVKLHALREIAASDSRLEAVRTSNGLVMRRAAKMLIPMLKKDRQQCQKPCRALHFEYAAIGFVTRFLHDDGPVQISDWAIGAQHLACFSFRL